MSCSFRPYNEVCNDNPEIYRQKYGKFPVYKVARGDTASDILYLNTCMGLFLCCTDVYLIIFK